MALSVTYGRDDPGRMVALNGPLVALLCAAYFVLVVCALSYGQSPSHGVGRSARRDGEIARSCSRRSDVSGACGSEAAAPVAYALMTMEREARSRRLDQTINAVVLGLQSDPANRPVEQRRTERCERGGRAQNRPRTLSKTG
jgi:hypothetical protein